MRFQASRLNLADMWLTAAILVCTSVVLAAPAQAGVTPGAAIWSPGPDAAGGAVAGSQFTNGGWQLKFQPNSWLQRSSDNARTALTVYAHSSVTGTEMQTHTTIVISVP